MRRTTINALPQASRPTPVRRLISAAASPAATGARGALEKRRDLSEGEAYAQAESLIGAPDPITNYAARRGD